MKHLVHVISTPSGIGGAEVVLLDIVAGGTDRGWEQTVLNPFAASRSEQLGQRLEGVAYEAFPVAPAARTRSAPRAMRWLSRRVGELQPSVLQAYLVHAAWLAALVRPRAAPVRVLSHQHGMHLRAQGRDLAARVDRRLGARYDQVVACSEAVRAFLVDDYRYPAELVSSIRNGWSGNPLPRSRDEARPPTIVCTANFRAQKGHEVLIDAFERVASEIPNARLRLLGDGPEHDALTRRLAAKSLLGRVDLPGSQRDIWPDLANADVFALASHYEPLGIAVLEAMAAGLPVVATAVDGIPELVQPGVSGELVAAGDSGAMARSLVDLLRDPDRAASLGRAGREFAERNRMSETVAAYYELFEDLVAHA